MYSSTILFTVPRGNRTKKANLKDVVALWQRNRDLWLYGAPVRNPLFHKENPISARSIFRPRDVGCGGFPCRQLCLKGVRSYCTMFGVRKILAFRCVWATGYLYSTWCYQCGSQSIHQYPRCVWNAQWHQPALYSRYIKATVCTYSEDGLDYSVADPLGSRIPLQTCTCRIAKWHCYTWMKLYGCLLYYHSAWHKL